MKPKESKKKPVVRCAIYTRKSTDEGLEKEFNTLDAQREAGEAYIASQKNEGWVCLPDRYDDGGFSGGNIERPALQRLLEDVKDGKVNCIIVYKLDRLSRSLMDFAKIVEILESNNATFVSVTQHFNTKDSMGRLTLNILLSFAQFEREIISERTRDKIAAARRKGKWTGGTQMLGYDVNYQTGRLEVNPQEADCVRQIFNLYLDHRSLREVVRELEKRGWTSKTWITKKGNLHHGIPFNKQRLSKLLKNVVYIGKIRYKDEIYEGEHEGIIDPGIWREVQEQLRLGDRTPGDSRNRYKALLRGLLHCKVCNSPMLHLPVSKNARKVYRYYVCMNAHDNGWDRCPSPSVPADQIEGFVLERLVEIRPDNLFLEEVLEQVEIQWQERINGIQREISRLETHISTLEQSDFNGYQQELLSARAQKRNMESRFIEITRSSISAAACADATGRFKTLWEHLSTDERSWLLSLIFERIDYDGSNGKINFQLHPTGLSATTN